jgi:hypothetical protein
MAFIKSSFLISFAVGHLFVVVDLPMRHMQPVIANAIRANPMRSTFLGRYKLSKYRQLTIPCDADKARPGTLTGCTT